MSWLHHKHSDLKLTDQRCEHVKQIAYGEIDVNLDSPISDVNMSWREWVPLMMSISERVGRSSTIAYAGRSRPATGLWCCTSECAGGGE